METCDSCRLGSRYHFGVSIHVLAGLGWRAGEHGNFFSSKKPSGEFGGGCLFRLGSPGKWSHEGQRTFPAFMADTSSNVPVAFSENPRLGCLSMKKGVRTVGGGVPCWDVGVPGLHHLLRARLTVLASFMSA